MKRRPLVLLLLIVTISVTLAIIERARLDQSLPISAANVSAQVANGSAPGLSIAADGTDVVLTWTEATTVTAYEVHRSATPFFTPDGGSLLTSLPAGTTMYTDTGVTGDPSISYFYQVRTLGAGPNAISNEVGEIDYPLNNTGGQYSMVALPFATTAITDAASLASYVSGVSAVLKWNPATQAFRFFVPPATGDNFTLAPGKVAFVQLSAGGPDVVTMVGDVTAVLHSIAPGGFSFMSLPLNRSDLTDAASTAADISSVNSLLGWNEATQTFRFFVPPATGDNFQTQVGTPFVLDLGAAGPSAWPVITVGDFAPPSGMVGATVTITGTNFIGASGVTFGGTPAISYSVDSLSQIRAEVPQGAATGPIGVSNLSGGGVSPSDFIVLAPEITINGFSPASGPIGTAVIISGSNFISPSGSGPQVTINQQGGGTLAAPVMQSAPTSLTFVIPPGAASGPLAVTVESQSATSVDTLTVTPSTNFTLFTEPNAVNIIGGQSTSFAINLVGINDFAQLATLAVSGLPVGATADFSPAQITAGQTALLTMTVPDNQLLGSSLLTISASATVEGIDLTDSVEVTLNVLPITTSFLGRSVVDDAVQTPLAGVTVTMLGRDGAGNDNGCTGQTTVSDEAGNFAFTNLPPECSGPQLIRYDGTTVTAPPGQYAGVDLFYDLTIDQVTVSPVLIHLPRIDNAETVMVQQNAPVDQTFTFQTIPNLTTTVYAGTIFTLLDGSQPDPFPLTAIQVPIDRLPDQMPPSTTTIDPFIVAFQPANATASQPVAVFFPNLTNTPPGTNVALSTLDPTLGVMVTYGTGTIADDGTQVIPDSDPANPGRRYGLVNFDWHGPVVPPNPQNPCSTGTCCATVGKPIDLATGIEIITETDIEVNGPRGSLAIARTYRTLTDASGPFGIGTNHNYGYLLNTNDPQGSAIVSLVMPDGNQFPFIRQSDGTFLNSNIPTLRGAVMSVVSGGRVDLRWKDGTVYQFAPRTLAELGFRASTLESITDPNGNTISLVRNTSRPIQISEIIDPVGRKLHLSYDAADRITSIVDPIGRRVRYTYNAQGTLETVTDHANGITRYDYDAANRLTQITDPRGVIVVQNVYDSNGRVIEQVRADGGRLRFTYLLLNPQVMSTPVGSTGAPDNILNNTGGSSSGFSFVGSPTLVTIVTDPLGRQTTYRFNPEGLLTDVTDPLGQKRIFEWQPGTNLLVSVSGNGVCDMCGDPRAGDQTFTYDANGNLASVTDGLGNTTTFTYDSTFNKITSITDPLNNTATFTYDGAGNLLTVTDESNQTTRFAYNQLGLMTQITDPLNKRTALSYDSFGNLAALTDAISNTTIFLYDAVSRPIATIDSLGQRSQTMYDDLNRPVRLIDAHGNATQFTYDPVGNLLALTDPRDNTTTFTYDPQNRLSSRTTQLGYTEIYAYDQNDNLTTYVDREGQTSQFIYDSLDRLTGEVYQDGSTVTYHYDAHNRLARADDSEGGIIDFVYDSVGRLLSEIGPYGAVQYAYDPLSRVTARGVIGLPIVDYTYDPVGNLLTAAAPQASVSYAYNARNQPLTLARSNGVSTTYTYDPLGRVSSLTHLAGTTVLNSQAYNYDVAGNRTDYSTDIAQSLTTLPRTNQYDDDNRLVSSTTQSGTTSYAYDNNGNLISETGPTGNTTYNWDARNRLASIVNPNGETISFRYDFAGNLISQRTTGPGLDYARNFLLDDLTNVVHESNSGGGQFAYLTGRHIDDHLAVATDNGSVEFGLMDPLNSTVAAVDQTGAVQGRFFYEPFGQTTVAGDTYLFQYTGRVPISGKLYYYRARYYDSELGRFISEDPVGFGGGDVNLYRYVLNDPISLVDPLGLTTVLIEIDRSIETSQSTIGTLTLNSQRIGYSLELPWRNNQTNRSRIPAGTYFGEVFNSPTFGMNVIRLLNVPGRGTTAPILIHPGNWPGNTTGCILPGTTYANNAVYNSRDAFNRIMARVSVTRNLDRILGDYTDIIIIIRDP